MRLKHDDRRYYRQNSVPHSEKSSRSKEELFEEMTMRRRREAEQRQRSPSPDEDDVSPRDRFKDAKEKFLLMERERIQEQQRRMREELKAQKDKTFLKRHESVVYPNTKEYTSRY